MTKERDEKMPSDVLAARWLFTRSYFPIFLIYFVLDSLFSFFFVEKNELIPFGALYAAQTHTQQNHP